MDMNIDIREDNFRLVQFNIFPYPLLKNDFIKYIESLPEDAVIVASRMSDFELRMELIVRSANFEIVPSNCSVPNAFFNRTFIVEDDMGVDEYEVDWYIGEPIERKDSYKKRINS